MSHNRIPLNTIIKFNLIKYIGLQNDLFDLINVVYLDKESIENKCKINTPYVYMDKNGTISKIDYYVENERDASYLIENILNRNTLKESILIRDDNYKNKNRFSLNFFDTVGFIVDTFNPMKYYTVFISNPSKERCKCDMEWLLNS